MASRAILRKQKYLVNFLNRPTFVIRAFSFSEHGRPPLCDGPQDLGHTTSHAFADTDLKADRSKHQSSTFAMQQFFWHLPHGVPTLDHILDRKDLLSSFRVARMSELVRHASTATAGQPETRNGNSQSKEKASKQVKEASPEDCDQAVEGLSTAKAKVKAKQMLESQNFFAE
ncbi:hypothetical protein BT93_B1059 [Corymbia citriodora subsp. variegata]|nr:hypothetical protein BT93_B1059 [Corymbia citriodora subsp. variegata]